jgi:hypothetical protein
VAKTVELHQAHTIENAYLGERFTLELKAGKHIPKSEVEEFALQLAVEAEEAEERVAAVAAAQEAEGGETAPAAPVIDDPDEMTKPEG